MDDAIQNSKERFINLCRSINRDGIDALMAWLETTDFYEAPASKAYHGAFRGGLLEHSLHVYDQLKRLLVAFPEIRCSEDTAVIISLFHDFCKINFYATERRNRKNGSGQWESYDAYTINEKFPFGGHGSKSVFIIQNFIRLSAEEAVAINCHMSAWDNPHVGSAYEHFPLAWLLSVADQASTYIDEK